jgi:hypothetical protein
MIKPVNNMAANGVAVKRPLHFVFLLVLCERSCCQWREIDHLKTYSKSIKLFVGQEQICRPIFSPYVSTKPKSSGKLATRSWKVRPTPEQTLKFINLVSDFIVIVLLQCNISR